MKNVLILHGTGDSSQDNWFPWLKEELEKHHCRVFVPDLPLSQKPNLKRYNDFLFTRWQFDSDSVIIGHSSGAMATLGILEQLPNTVVIDTAILIGAFKNDLGWESLKEIFIKPFDFPEIKKHAKRIILIHSDDDPYCPLDHAEYLTEELGAELLVLKGQKHFSVSTAGNAYKRFPFLLELLKKNS